MFLCLLHLFLFNKKMDEKKPRSQTTWWTNNTEFNDFQKTSLAGKFVFFCAQHSAEGFSSFFRRVFQCHLENLLSTTVAATPSASAPVSAAESAAHAASALWSAATTTPAARPDLRTDDGVLAAHAAASTSREVMFFSIGAFFSMSGR